MTTHTNPAHGKKLKVSEDAGQLTLNMFVFDFAQAAYRPAAMAQNDKIQIGIVPAGEKLVPELCRGSFPILDSNGSPTGDYTIGYDDDTDALKGSAASETAVVLFGEDWLIATGEIGSKTADVPIYLYLINASATVPVTGKIRFNQVTRPWSDEIDGA